jgi:ABC-type dipeptide/oligopeptide/nickel transport system permease subunit
MVVQEFWTTPEGVLENFPYFRSPAHAAVVGIAAGLLFGSFFGIFAQYHQRINNHGLLFEHGLTFVCIGFFMGYAISDDYIIRGPSSVDFVKNAATLVEFYWYIFYGLLGLFAVFLIISVSGSIRKYRPARGEAE